MLPRNEAARPWLQVKWIKWIVTNLVRGHRSQDAFKPESYFDPRHVERDSATRVDEAPLALLGSHWEIKEGKFFHSEPCESNKQANRAKLSKG